jgi:predicted RNase H-like HicB family nuclease
MKTATNVATVPELPGGHTQARSQDDLMNRIREAISLYPEIEEPQQQHDGWRHQPCVS